MGIAERSVARFLVPALVLSAAQLATFDAIILSLNPLSIYFYSFVIVCIFSPQFETMLVH